MRCLVAVTLFGDAHAVRYSLIGSVDAHSQNRARGYPCAVNIALAARYLRPTKSAVLLLRCFIYIRDLRITVRGIIFAVTSGRIIGIEEVKLYISLLINREYLDIGA